MSNVETPCTTSPALTRKDFLSKTDPRWCPGCGCYSIFKALTGVFPQTGVPREKLACISGIGCSSRFPYYVNSFGFHTVHGRAPTVALGLKLARPDLSVWMMTGDGDALSIGGNHFMHIMRRNPDIKMVLFNNSIYGLTKGQASPTTRLGQKTKTTPQGSFDNPVRPLSLAIASGATFAARVTDADGELLNDVLMAAANHKGMAFVEVMMNCVIFNDGAFESFTNKETRQETTVRLKHGEPMLFGANKDKGLKLVGANPKVVSLAENPSALSEVAIHDARSDSTALAYVLSQIEEEGVPLPLGIFRQVEKPVYEENYRLSPLGDAEMSQILNGAEAWKA